MPTQQRAGVAFLETAFVAALFFTAGPRARAGGEVHRGHHNRPALNADATCSLQEAIYAANIARIRRTHWPRTPIPRQNPAGAHSERPARLPDWRPSSNPESLRCPDYR